MAVMAAMGVMVAVVMAIPEPPDDLGLRSFL